MSLIVAIMGKIPLISRLTNVQISGGIDASLLHPDNLRERNSLRSRIDNGSDWRLEHPVKSREISLLLSVPIDSGRKLRV